MGREHDPEILKDEVEIKKLIRRIEFIKGDIDISNPAIFSSPALRCRQTADLVKDLLGLKDLDAKVEEGLKETDFGEASGLTVQQIMEKYPLVGDAWRNKQSKTHFPNGETYHDVQNRAYQSLENIVETSKDASAILIFTHVDVIKMIIFKILDIDIDNKPLLILENGGIAVIALSKDKLKLKKLI